MRYSGSFISAAHFGAWCITQSIEAVSRGDIWSSFTLIGHRGESATINHAGKTHGFYELKVDPY